MMIYYDVSVASLCYICEGVLRKTEQILKNKIMTYSVCVYQLTVIQLYFIDLKN